MVIDPSQFILESADTVLKTLRDRNAPVSLDHPKGMVLAPVSLVEIYLKPAGSTKVAQVMALSDDIALAVKNDNARITQSGGKLIIQIPYGPRKPITIESLYAAPSAPYTATLGCDLYGKPIGLSLADPSTPHALIAGTTGSGKTALAQAMVMSLCKRHTRKEMMLVVIDPKADRAPWFETAVAGHLGPPIARTPDAAIKVLRQVVKHMGGVSEPVTRLVVYVDEVADLILSGGIEVQNLLSSIAQRGRSAGIHLFAATQKPSAKHLGPLLTANLPVRLVGRVVNASDSALACGQAGCGAEKLLGKGDFIFVDGARVVRFQAAMPQGYQSGGSKPAQSVPVPDWTAPAQTPVIELPAPDEPKPETERLDKAQAAAVYWYRKANPKPDGYTQTELARVIWPDLKTLAGGYIPRIQKIIALANQIQ